MLSRARRFVTFSVAFASTLLAQQDPPAAPSLLPLHEAARWTYDVARNQQRERIPVKEVSDVTDEGGFTLPDGERVHQLRVTGGREGATFECWSVRQDGVYLHGCIVPSRRGTMLDGATPMRIVALPLGHTAAWEWEGPLAGVEGATPCMWKHRATLVARDEQVKVPAGTFRAVHVKIVSERAGLTHERELWLAPGTGIVRDEQRVRSFEESRVLTAHAPGRDARREVLLAELEECLKNPAHPPYNMTPGIVWVEPVEAMLLPGRIAVVKAETWTRCWYVDDTEARAFDYRSADNVAHAAKLAFGTDTALPPETMPLRSLALLLARTHAARCGLGNVREVQPTILPQRKVPASGRTEHVELIGGANDGTDKHVALWLTIDRSSTIQLVSDAEPPGRVL